MASGPGPAPGWGIFPSQAKLFHVEQKKSFREVGTPCERKKQAEKKIKKLKKKVDRTRFSLTLSPMNLINSLPSTAAADVAKLSPAEIAEMEAFFSFVDAVNDEVDSAWDRLASLVDSGAL